MGGQGGCGLGAPHPLCREEADYSCRRLDPVCVGAGNPEVSPATRSELGCPRYASSTGSSACPQTGALRAALEREEGLRVCSKTRRGSGHTGAPNDCYKLSPPQESCAEPWHSHSGTPWTLQCHPVHPVCPSCSPPTRSPVPHVALGHSLVTQNDPLDARPEEDNGADVCRVVKESWEDT